jgi:hypothetical protein
VVVMATDWAFDLQNKWLRLLLSVTAVAVCAVVAWRFLLKPQARRLALPTVARWLELHHPEIQERISTAMSVAQRGEVAQEGFVKQLMDQAVADASKLDAKQELSNKMARKPLWSAVAGAVALLGLFAAAPSVFPVLFKRALTPLADSGNIYAASIRFLTKDAQTVAAHDAFPVEAIYTAPKEQRAVLVVTYPDGTEVREQMTEDPTLPTANVKERGLRYSLPTAGKSNP